MYVCNCCKKIFPESFIEPMKLTYHFQYGSSHDGDMFDMTICPDCADTVAAAIEQVCEVSPIVEVEDYGIDEEAEFPDDEDDDEGGTGIYS